jgi:hypothetical protein
LFLLANFGRKVPITSNNAPSRTVQPFGMAHFVLISNFFCRLPHVVELGIPRPQGAAEECLVYDEFKACRMVSAKHKTLLI